MASRLQQQYQIAPAVPYNVFPLAQAGRLLPPPLRPGNTALRLHWVGQTAGPGKGLEEAVEAAALAGGGVELCVRCMPAGDFGVKLESMAREKNVALTFLPHVHHDELAGAMGCFDVGLALERLTNPNSSITVSNKLFLYMLAGLALAASDTPGQREVMEQAPAAGFIYPCGRPDLLAAQFRRWRDDRNLLRTAQSAAWQAARDRFCWDVEKPGYLQLLETPPARRQRTPSW